MVLLPVLVLVSVSVLGLACLSVAENLYTKVSGPEGELKAAAGCKAAAIGDGPSGHQDREQQITQSTIQNTKHKTQPPPH